MELTLLGSILLLRVVQSISGKSCSKLLPTKSNGVIGYLALSSGLSAAVAAVVLLLSGDAVRAFAEMPAVGWLIAVATGTAIALSTLCSLNAMRGASVALSSLFSAAGLLVPTISGIFIFNQSVGIGQWVGILCLLAAAVLLASSSGKTNGKINAKTIVCLFGSMLSNGSTMLLQTLYKANVPNGSVSLYSFLQFAVPAVVLFILCACVSAKQGEGLPMVEKKLLIFTVLGSAVLFGISQISTIASEIIPVAVLFPISDGGGTVISAIVAATIFKEKFTVKSVLGVIIGVGGLVMIKLLAA